MQTRPCCISVLSDTVINQIAAGEVIENPASVVKELVENALDAGSTEILVEVRHGGQQLIRISDNGCGMNEAEAKESLKRHATSKLEKIDDFNTIFSMGFRGEALPSIASISKFKMITRKKGEPLAVTVSCEGLAEIKIQEGSRQEGTTIDIEDLFFNVPVRQKFQKSEGQNLREILKHLNNLALANHDKSFKLVSNGKNIFHYICPKNLSSEEPYKKRVKDVLGLEYFKELCFVDVQLEDYTCRGYIGKPDLVRSTRQGQYIFVNKRVVNSSFISSVIKDAFFTQISSQKFPVFTLYLEIDPSKVDVNVHPQKKELRFQEESKIKELMNQAVRKVLEGEFNQELKKESFSYSGSSFPKESSKGSFKSSFSSSSKEKQESFPIKPSWTDEVDSLKKEHLDFFVGEDSNKESQTDLFKTTEAETLNILAKKGDFVLIEDSGNLFPDLDPDCESNRWFMLDLKALYTRVFFDDCLKNKEENSEFIENLLIPVQLELSSQEAEVLGEHLNFFSSLGFVIESFGKDSFIIQSIPHFLKSAPVASIVLEILSELPKNRAKEALGRHRDKYLLRALSHMSKVVSSWSYTEIKLAIVSLLSSKDNHFCPRGKKVWDEIKIEDIFKG
jgi:DNA mismatch repair protein MutL